MPTKIILANLSGIKSMPGGRWRHLVKAGSRWPMTIGYARHVDYYPFPFSLAYGTALLKRSFPDLDVQGIDGVVDDLDEEALFRRLQLSPPDIFISEVTLITLNDDLAFIKRVKSAFKCMVIVTGVYPSVFLENIFLNDTPIDYAIYGEYELSLDRLVRVVVDGNDSAAARDIPGIIFKNNDGIFKHKQRAAIQDLNALPCPDRQDFPPDKYVDFAVHFPCVSIMASRGCPAGCVYCVERHVIYASPAYRMRDPLMVVDEMLYCRDFLGAKQFYFDDQSLVVNKGYIASLCAEMQRRALGVPWTCMADAMFLDRPSLELMAEAGCIGIKFGVESANEAILKHIHKPLDLTKVQEVVAWCRALKISTHATFCVGLPHESEQTLGQTTSFIKALDVDSAQVSRAVPYPGTPFYTWAKENGFLRTEDLDLFDGMSSSVLNYPQLSSGMIDLWYEKISRIVARRKLMNYIRHPWRSFFVLMYMLKHQGFKKTFSALTVFLGRSY